MLIGPELEFYRNIPKNFTSNRMPLAPDQTLSVKVPGARTGNQRTIANAGTAYPPTTGGSSSDRSIALTHEIWIDDNFTGKELQQSTIIDLRTLYLEQNALAIADLIIANGMAEIRDNLPGGNSEVISLGTFGRHTLEAKRAEYDLAKIPKRGRWAVVSTEYASVLANELVTINNTGLAPEGKDAYVRGSLPEFIAGFRIYETAGITEEIIFGNQNTLGVVAALPWIPGREAGGVEYMDVQDSITGLPLQFRHRWVTDPVEQWETKQRLYIGHKLFAEETTRRIATA